MAKETSDASFDQDVIEASKEKPVLVDFWAPWCGPCRMQGPILDELAEEVGDWAEVVKLNVDENQQKAGEFGVSSIPSLKVFRNGTAVAEMVGVQQKDALKEALESNK